MAKVLFLTCLVQLALLYLASSATPTTQQPTAKGVNWALLIAGSKGYYNYRHQADVCHAYHVLNSHGIPDERIVVMMYDDIAHNSENPTKGIIINHPNGTDVYRGVPKDYTKEDVTPENFLNVLQGNEDKMKGIGSGKVIKSNKNDHVFVFFADHGAPGLIAFPNGELKANQLHKAILSMNKLEKYGKMVFYIEACESGSMFDQLLPTNINVFATTASNSHESSYACYYDDKRETYLGDVYSVNWMEDSDKQNLSEETLLKQYMIVKAKTNTSHVMKFGDQAMATMAVAEFQGTDHTKPIVLPRAPLDAVASPDVQLAVLHRRLAATNDIKHMQSIIDQIKAVMQLRRDIDVTIKKIVGLVSNDEKHSARLIGSRRPIRNLDCYDGVITHFSRLCYSFSKYEYALRKVQVLVNMCEENIAPMEITKSMDRVCLGFD